MKSPVRMIIIVATFIVVVSPLSALTVAAQEPPITDAQIARIRSNCDSAENTINQLQVSDALLRVNRGQLYESISSSLMTPFNSRVSKSPFDTTTLNSITNNYQHKLDTFRSDYQTYEQQLSKTLNINCSNEPVEFYDSAVASESDRLKVYGDTTQLDQYISDYQASVSAFEQNYEPTSQKGTQ